MTSNHNEGTSFSPSEATPCANGCGFFGTPSNMNLCSKCFRDIHVDEERKASAKDAVEKSFSLISRQHAAEIDVKSLISVVPDESLPVSPVDVTLESPPIAVTGGDPPQPQGPTRCYTCSKKIGLTGFKCKCGYNFCGVHRYPEIHECSFDYKASGRDVIAKSNPVIRADKVERF